MSTRKKLNPDSENVDTIYSNWLAQVVALIKPRNLYLILGRGGGKTNDFLTERLMDMVYEMPGAPVALTAATYTDLQKNILHVILDGLERKGWKEGIHYVVGKEPPEVTPEMRAACPPEYRDQLWKPYNRLMTYKHTLIFFTGFNITLVSLDRPSAAAGNSYVHIIGDESKFFPEAKIAKLTKAVRGYYAKYGDCVYYRGQTLTTDMPNPNNTGEYDWIHKMAKRMDKGQILRILDCAFVMNEVTEDLVVALEDGDEKVIANKRRIYDRWLERYNAVRHKSSLYYVASSYINAEILRPEYFEDEFAGGLDDVLTAILSSKPRLQSGNSFYAALNAGHFYSNGSSEKYADFFGIRDNEDCRILKFLRENEPIEAGVDFGNMISVIIAQEHGKTYRILKTLHTLPPLWLRDVADLFIEYFKPHKNKVLRMYYDRAGNQYKGVKQDLAGKLKAAIERDADGKATGWRVELMSRNQGTIYTWDEYDFMAELLPGNNPSLPVVAIDSLHAKALKCSLEIAPTKIKEFKGRKRISKDKRSEGLPVHRLLYESTNFSDAFKYLMCRPKWMAKVKGSKGSGLTVG